ncbi:hypothetical protein N2K95_09020 [Arthrobacter zhaoxinii]|uniref:Uncharacterized protein n=1 Tax=Arthrobacter zhaoxinii TaxID=2964616 RepID=A0ABY5YM22_9MICC|nr:hypothetical protein [Arthrobacter zhaoxinii]UWX95840.1 hypothetical protein N2K95_09020 [Arthrobacter zhaoxinii]
MNLDVLRERSNTGANDVMLKRQNTYQYLFFLRFGKMGFPDVPLVWQCVLRVADSQQTQQNRRASPLVDLSGGRLCKPLVFRHRMDVISALGKANAKPVEFCVPIADNLTRVFSLRVASRGDTAAGHKRPGVVKY